MRGRSFDAAGIDPAIERIEHDDYRARTPLGAQKRAVRAACRRARYDAEDLRRAIDDVCPDALLVDVDAWGALAVAKAWGGAWASYSNWLGGHVKKQRRRREHVGLRRAWSPR